MASEDEGFLGSELEGRRPEIAYPTIWPFKLIGEDEFHMRRLVAEVLGERDYELELSNISSAGRYRSLLLRVTVTSDDDRHAIGEALQRSEHVHMVL